MSRAEAQSRCPARKAFVGLAWLFVLAVAIQFLLAGLGVLGGESMEAHRQWGFIVLHLIPILMFIAAIVGRMGRNVLGPTGGAVPARVCAAALRRRGAPSTLATTLHVLNALFVFALGYRLARARRRTVWGMGVAA